MTYKQSIALFTAFIMGGLGILGLTRQGFYPVAIVGFDVITARSLEKDFSSAYIYYQKAAATYGANPELIAQPESRLEIKRAALDNLILNAMIYQEINFRLKGDLGKIAEQKLAQFENNVNLKESAKTLYGLEFSYFKKQVFICYFNKRVFSWGYPYYRRINFRRRFECTFTYIH